MLDGDRIEEVRSKLTQVFRFLRALNELRNPVQTLVEAQPWVLWFKELPEHASVVRGEVLYEGDGEAGNEPTTHELAQQGGGTDFVLKVSRPELARPPEPPEEVLPWLEDGWQHPGNAVALRDSLPQGSDRAFPTFDSDPNRKRLFEAWLEERTRWAERELPARQGMRVFEKLYALQASIEREPERLELMLGDGILDWRDGKVDIYHPILLQQLQLKFEPSVPEFTLVETSKPRELYTALFRSVPDVKASAVSQCLGDLEEGNWHPLGQDETTAYFRRAVALLSPTHGKLVGLVETPPPGGPFMIRQPVIFLRPRSLGFATAIERVLEDLQTRTVFPVGLTNVVGVESGPSTAGDSEAAERRLFSYDQEVLLTKEANAEQLAIARRLARHGAVLVQGPPGTGKTHTIANLIGHLLAKGQSVLVTSHSAKALRVLRSQVVKPLQPLCVSALDGTTDELQSSVDAISERLSGSDGESLEREAERLEERRAELLRQLAAAEHELEQARQDEYRPIVVAGQEHPPADAARYLRTEANRSAWIPGPVASGAPIPLLAGEVILLYKTNDSVSVQAERELALGLPDPGSLPTPSQFEKWISDKTTIESRDIESGRELWREVSPSQAPETLLDLADHLGDAFAVLDNAPEWALSTMCAGREGSGSLQSWLDLLAEIDELVRLADAVKPVIMKGGPELPGQWVWPEVEAQLTGMVEHVANGGALTAMVVLFHKDWKKIIGLAKVRGRRPQSVDDFESLQALAKLESARTKVLERWARQVAPLAGPDPREFASEPEHVLSQYGEIMKRNLSWWPDTVTPLLNELAAKGFDWNSFAATVPPSHSKYGEVLGLRDIVVQRMGPIVQAQSYRCAYRTIQGNLRQTLDLLERFVGDGDNVTAVRELAEAVRSIDPAAYRKAYEQLVDLTSRRRNLETRQELLSKLEPAAPAWASAIRSRNGVHGVGEPPGAPEKAWLWRQLNDEIERRHSRDPERVKQRISQLTRDLQTVTGELVEKRAWASQISRTSIEQRVALQGWKSFMKRVGKRTGIRAPRFLAEARKLIPVCQTAVPVWIMPLNQVVETFDPRKNSFDTVIIDEASQADVMALLALYLGKNVVVVGDEEQVSPEAVGQNVTQVQQLIDVHLPGIPNAALYDGLTSVYDLAHAYAGTVMLREHFRCVPDIIEFSNRLSYKGKILPLRNASHVLTRPHTIPYRVEGFREANGVNEEEARAVASILVAATEQPEYDGASFGVISLLGLEQAMRIDSLLQKYLSPSEYVARNIQCGNPAQFQGDERDVVFLSMVDSPVEGGPLGLRPDPGDRFKKRFNVAASRAKDQLWVVHSVDPETDLKPDDLRRRLIMHARNPRAFSDALAKEEEKTESEFESLVLRSLVAAGYQVQAQVPAGGYRIDMVVRGNGREVAVECDGDRYHPQEKLREDLERQAILERARWKFIRIRGSQFFRDPDGTMQNVMERLSQMGITPQSVPSSAPPEETDGTLVERVVRRAAELRREWEAAGFETLFSPQRPSRRSVARPGSRQSPPVTRVDKNTLTDVGKHSPVESSVPSPATGNPRNDHATRKTAPRAVQSAKRTSQQPLFEDLLSESPKESTVDEVAFLRSHGLDVVDKRGSGGSLWVVGGRELAPLLKELRTTYGVRFIFAENGGRATRHRPAWFSK